MKIKTTVTGRDLTEGIGFYGETNHDNETIDRLKELAVVMDDVAYDLANLYRQVEGRHEHSAKAIKRRLDNMRNDLIWTIFDEGMAAHIGELLGEEK